MGSSQIESKKLVIFLLIQAIYDMDIFDLEERKKIREHFLNLTYNELDDKPTFSLILLNSGIAFGRPPKWAC